MASSVAPSSRKSGNNALIEDDDDFSDAYDLGTLLQRCATPDAYLPLDVGTPLLLHQLLAWSSVLGLASLSTYAPSVSTGFAPLIQAYPPYSYTWTMVLPSMVLFMLGVICAAVRHLRLIVATFYLFAALLIINLAFFVLQFVAIFVDYFTLGTHNGWYGFFISAIVAILTAPAFLSIFGLYLDAAAYSQRLFRERQARGGEKPLREIESIERVFLSADVVLNIHWLLGFSIFSILVFLILLVPALLAGFAPALQAYAPFSYTWTMHLPTPVLCIVGIAGATARNADVILATVVAYGALVLLNLAILVLQYIGFYANPTFFYSVVGWFGVTVSAVIFVVTLAAFAAALGVLLSLVRRARYRPRVRRRHRHTRRARAAPL